MSTAKQTNSLLQVLLRYVAEKYSVEVEFEFRFHPVRRWRFDACFPELKIAIEQEGAVWVQGRHTRGSGFVKDMEKYNAAAELGYRLFRYTPKDVKSGKMFAQVEGVVKADQAIICAGSRK